MFAIVFILRFPSSSLSQTQSLLLEVVRDKCFRMVLKWSHKRYLFYPAKFKILVLITSIKGILLQYYEIVLYDNISLPP